MALSMKMRANARVVSGRRVAAVAPRVVPFSSASSSVLRSGFAAEVSVDIRRVGRSRIVVEAVSRAFDGSRSSSPMGPVADFSLRAVPCR